MRANCFRIIDRPVMDLYQYSGLARAMCEVSRLGHQRSRNLPSSLTSEFQTFEISETVTPVQYALPTK